MSERHIFRYWSPVVLWMVFIFWMSSETFSSDNTSSLLEEIFRFLAPSLTPEGLETIHGIIRKLGHVSEYFVLGLLLYRAFSGGISGHYVRRHMLISVVIGAVYALSDEYHQSFVASRTASLADVGIDITGGILAQFFIAVRLRLKRE